MLNPAPTPLKNISSRGLFTTDLLVPVCTLAFFFVVARGNLGLPLQDDMYYMIVSHTLKFSSFAALQQWAPLYLAFVRFLDLFTANHVTVFFASWATIVTLVVLLPAIFRIRGAWLYSIVLAPLPLLMAIPLVGLFGGLIVLLGFLIFLRTPRTFLGASFLACVTCFVTAFARPEFNYATFLAAALTIMLSVVQWRRASGKHTRWPIALAAFGSLTLAVVLFAAARQDHFQRSGFAFAQHFVMRALEDGRASSMNTQYALQKFGLHADDAQLSNLTASDFLRANPHLFLAHLVENLVDYRCFAPILLCSVLFLIPWVVKSRSPFRPHSIFVLLASLGPLAGTIVIYPREHYYSIVGPVWILFAVLMLRPPTPRLSIAIGAMTLSCAALVLLQSRAEGPMAEGGRVTMLRTLNRVQCMQRVDSTLRSPNAVFEASANSSTYFLHHRAAEGTADLATWAAFEQWVAAKQPAMITLDDAVLQHYGVTHAQADAFLLGAQGYNKGTCSAAAAMYLYTSP